MIRENWRQLLVTDEPVEFEKQPAVEVGDCREINYPSFQRNFIEECTPI
jgi:hypothetical protein